MRPQDHKSLPVPFIVLVIAIVFFGGCGDRKLRQGQFIDSPVSNLSYSSESVEGITDQQGFFQYRNDDVVEFRLGNLPLGTRQGQAVITPLDLVENGTFTSPRVVNTAVLLQSLDNDGDLDNGIQIPDAVFLTDISTINLDLTTADFQQSAQVLNAVRSIQNDNSATLVTSEAAIDHLQNSINAIDNISQDDESISASASQTSANANEEVVLTGVLGSDLQNPRWQQLDSDSIQVSLTLGTESSENDLTDLQASFVAPVVNETASLNFIFSGENDQGEQQITSLRVSIVP